MLSWPYRVECQSKDGGRYNASMGVDLLSLKRKPKSKSKVQVEE